MDPRLVALPLLVAACSTEPVRRHIELTAHVDLPMGVVEAHETALHVDFAEVEPLAAGHVYVAWASTPTATVYLGELEPEHPFEVAPADFGITTDEIDELRVTIEEAHSAPLDGPSTLPVLEATLAGASSAPLTIPGMDEEALSGAMATATLEDTAVEITSMGLPKLPSALFYGVWAELEASAEPAATEPPGGHVHSLNEGHAEEATGGPVFVGALDAAGALSVDLGSFVASARSMTICVEARLGAAASSPSCVLEGEVVLPSGAAEGTAEHVH